MCCRFKSSGMWCCLVEHEVCSVLKVCSAFIFRVQHSEMNSHASKKCTSAWTAPLTPWLPWSLLDIDYLHCTVSFNTPFRAHSHCCLWPSNTSISCANVTHFCLWVFLLRCVTLNMKAVESFKTWGTAHPMTMSHYKRLEFFKWMVVGLSSGARKCH